MAGKKGRTWVADGLQLAFTGYAGFLQMILVKFMAIGIGSEKNTWKISSMLAIVGDGCGNDLDARSLLLLCFVPLRWHRCW